MLQPRCIYVQSFVVGNIVSEEDKELTILGRCGDIPLRLGDKFYMVFCYERGGIESIGQPKQVVKQYPIELEIKEIFSYDYFLDELGQGMTGRLKLSGNGLDKIEERDILSLFLHRDLTGETLKFSRLLSDLLTS